MVFSSSRSHIWDFCLAPRAPGSREPYTLLALTEHRHSPPSQPLGRAAPFSEIVRVISDDLTSWRRQQVAFWTGPRGAWDDTAVWPGCIVQHQGVYHLFSTGSTRTAEGPRQGAALDLQIGLATSPDLVTWTRYPGNPVLDTVTIPAGTAHPEIMAGQPGWHLRQQHSDPWIVPAPEEAAFYAFFVAGAEADAGTSSGVVGCARSTDLLSWERLGPVTAPGLAGDLRALQVFPLDGRYYLLYSTTGADTPVPPDHRPNGDWQGTGYLVADHLTGPYQETDRAPLLPAPYTGARIVLAPDGAPVVLATRSRDDAGRPLGVISDPAPLTVLGDGRLRVEAARLWTPGWRLPNDLERVPPALVERGLLHGLVSLDWARTLAEAAGVHPTYNRAAIPRIEYLAAILQGAVALPPSSREIVEQEALDLALNGIKFVDGSPPRPDFRSLLVLLPALGTVRRDQARATALRLALAEPRRKAERLADLAPHLTWDACEQALGLPPEPPRTSSSPTSQPAGSPADQMAAHAQQLAQALVDELRGAPAAAPVESEQELVAAWHDDPDLDIEYHQFAEVMVLIPHLHPRSRAAAIELALERAGHVAHDSEMGGRDLSLRATALREIAPWLTSPNQRATARAITQASQLQAPVALGWPVEQARQQQELVFRDAFLGQPPARRWASLDAVTIGEVLTELPPQHRAALIDEALDALWYQLPGLDRDAFVSSGLRAAARFLTRDQVAASLQRFGLSPRDLTADRRVGTDIGALLRWLTDDRQRTLRLALVGQALGYAQTLRPSAAYDQDERQSEAAIQVWLAAPDEPRSRWLIEQALERHWAAELHTNPSGPIWICEVLYAVQEVSAAALPDGLARAASRAAGMAGVISSRRAQPDAWRDSRRQAIASNDCIRAARRWQADAILALLGGEQVPSLAPVPDPPARPDDEVAERYRLLAFDPWTPPHREEIGRLVHALDDAEQRAFRRHVLGAALDFLEPLLPSPSDDHGERSVYQVVRAAVERPPADNLATTWAPLGHHDALQAAIEAVLAPSEALPAAILRTLEAAVSARTWDRHYGVAWWLVHSRNRPGGSAEGAGAVGIAAARRLNAAPPFPDPLHPSHALRLRCAAVLHAVWYVERCLPPPEADYGHRACLEAALRWAARPNDEDAQLGAAAAETGGPPPGVDRYARDAWLAAQALGRSLAETPPRQSLLVTHPAIPFANAVIERPERSPDANVDAANAIAGEYRTAVAWSVWHGRAIPPFRGPDLIYQPYGLDGLLRAMRPYQLAELDRSIVKRMAATLEALVDPRLHPPERIGHTRAMLRGLQMWADNPSDETSAAAWAPYEALATLARHATSAVAPEIETARQVFTSTARARVQPTPALRWHDARYDAGQAVRAVEQAAREPIRQWLADTVFAILKGSAPPPLPL